VVDPFFSEEEEEEEEVGGTGVSVSVSVSFPSWEKTSRSWCVQKKVG
jgi:hypothetical protein